MHLKDLPFLITTGSIHSKTQNWSPVSWILVHKPVGLQLCSEIYWVFIESFIWVHLHAVIFPTSSLLYLLRTQQGQEPAKTGQCKCRSDALLTVWRFLLFCAFPSALPIIESTFLFCCLVLLQWITSLPTGVLIIHCFYFNKKALFSWYQAAQSWERANPFSSACSLKPRFRGDSAIYYSSLSASGATDSLERRPLEKREGNSNMAYEFLAHGFTLKDVLNNKRFFKPRPPVTSPRALTLLIYY